MNYYVPILKWKQGEQKATESLEPASKKKVFPLIEIPPIDFDWEKHVPKKTIDEHIKNISSTIETSFKEQQIFIDPFYVEDDCLLSTGLHVITQIVNEAKSMYNFKPVPVVGFNSNYDYINAVKLLISNKQVNDLCIRFSSNDFNSINPLLSKLLLDIPIVPEHCHLLIDLKEIESNTSGLYQTLLPIIINNLVHLNQWQSITIAATSFPTDLSKVKSNSHQLLPRVEYDLYNNASSNFQRFVQFGDYCISNPEPFQDDPRIMQMTANIRYTIKSHFLIVKGLNVRKNGFSQMKDLCNTLVNLPCFCGQNFSNGDSYIYGCAHGTESSGNATTWRKNGTNHHIAFVINQLTGSKYFV